jgi:L-fuculose-phosphate aldolase
MPLWKIKQDIVKVGRWCYEKGYVAATDGNMSARVGDLVAATPTGLCKGHLEAGDIVIVDLDGKKVEGRLDASSEILLHLEVYKKRDDVLGCVHAHPPTATGFAAARLPLAQCVLPEVVLTLGSIPLAEYATPGTPEVPQSVREHLADHDAFLLANHGTLTVGPTLEAAYYKLEKVEQFAKVMLVARQLGRIEALTPDDVRKLFDVSGLQFPAEPPCEACEACGLGAAEGLPNVDLDEETIREVTRRVLERLNAGE